MTKTTIEETLRQLKREIELAEYVDEDYRGGLEVELLRVAVGALEKQIPKMLASRQKNRTRVSGKCPHCGKPFSLESLVYYRDHIKYCPSCGQCLNWNKEE